MIGPAKNRAHKIADLSLPGTKIVEFPRHPVALVKGAQPGVAMNDVLEIVYGILRGEKHPDRYNKLHLT
jgi:hypothetical protein